MTTSANRAPNDNPMGVNSPNATSRGAAFTGAQPETTGTAAAVLSTQLTALEMFARRIPQLLPACVGAELLLVRHEKVRVVAVSDAHAAEVGRLRAAVLPANVELQILEPARLHALATDSASPVWNRYWQAMAADGGLTSFVALALEPATSRSAQAAADVAGPNRVANMRPGLVLHSRAADPRSGAGQDLLELVASTAAARLSAYVLADQVRNLEISLGSSRRIGMAMGILVERLRVTDTAAFEILKTASQRTNSKLRDVAEDVIMTGELPGAASTA